MVKPAYRLVFLGFLFTFFTLNLAASEDWLPVNKPDLEMKEYPGHPGISAVTLYRKHSFDDSRSMLTNYYRIKILTEAGRSEANIETIPFRANERIADFRARVVHPDGSIIPATGAIFEKTVVKYKGEKSTVKTMTLPEVTVGSIIEYQYRVEWPETSYRLAAWDLEDKLATREAHFFFKPYPVGYYTWHVTALGKLKGIEPKEQKDRTLTLDLENIDPYEPEEFMPPEANAKSWIAFYYVKGVTSVDKFWEEASTNWNKSTEDYLGKSAKVVAAVPAIVGSSPTPEAKIRVLYDKIQRMRNLSFEQSKTQKEIDRLKLDEAKSPDDVLARGFGYKVELLRLFVAMARAAGFEAAAVRVPDREELFFIRDFRSFRQFNTEIAYVRAEGKEYWLDPSTPYCPFGLLPWYYTDVIAIRSGKSGGQWVRTPPPMLEQATLLREGDLTVEKNGEITGEVKFTYSGQYALVERLGLFGTDDAERKKMIEDHMKEILPHGSTADLLEIKSLENGNDPLVYRVRIDVPSLTTATKTKLLLPLRLFSGIRNPFAADTRKQAIYFRYPHKVREVMTYTLGDGLTIANLPAQHNAKDAFGTYDAIGEKNNDGDMIQMRRTLTLRTVLMQPEMHYSSLRKFFGTVALGDEEPAVLAINAAK